MEGDLIYKDYQYEFRGLLFGSGTGIVCEGVEGLLSMAGVEPSDLPNQGGMGMFKGRDRLTMKSVVATLRPTGPAGAGIEEVLMSMEDAFQNTEDEEPFVFKRPGRGKRRVYVRCRRRDIPTSYELARGLGEVSVQLDSTDPRVYSNDEQSDDFTIAAGQVQGTLDVYMNGNLVYGTHPIIEIDGPTNDPVISNASDGNKQVQLGIDVPAGQTLVVDLAKWSFMLNGVSVYGPGVLLPGSRRWVLRPKVNQITVIRSNNNADADIRVRWRDAYS